MSKLIQISQVPVNSEFTFVGTVVNGQQTVKDVNGNLLKSSVFPQDVAWGVVFKQNKKSTSFVGMGGLDEQELFEIPNDTHVKLTPNNNRFFEGGIIFVRDLKWWESCIYIECRTIGGKLNDLAPVMCKVSNKSVQPISKGSTRFFFHAKQPHYNVESMILNNSNVFKSNDWFGCEADDWNFFEKAPLFFEKDELKYGDRDFDIIYDPLVKSFSMHDDKQVVDILTTYLSVVDSSESTIEDRKKCARILFILVEILSDGKSKQLLDCVESVLNKSAIGKDILGFVRKQE